MKIALLHQHFNTPEEGGALRSYYLAKALADHGMEVTVITGSLHPKRMQRKVDGINVIYLPVPYENKFKFSRRIRAYLRFARLVIRNRAALQYTDIIYAISTPLTIGLPALWFKRMKKIPYYFEVGDLWPEAPIQLGFIRNPLLKSFLHKFERIVYRNASKVIALSPQQEQILQQKTTTPIHRISNMADTEFFHPYDKRPEDAPFTIAYIGAVGFANGLAFYLDCAAQAQQANLPVKFLLCGEGGALDELKTQAREKNLTNLDFVDFQSRSGVREVMNRTDAVFVCYRNIPVLETGCPNKYFDGLAAGKVILINFGGWIREEIERQGCGYFINPENTGAIVPVLRQLISNPEEVLKMQTAARALAYTYARSRITSDFIRLFHKERV